MEIKKIIEIFENAKKEHNIEEIMMGVDDDFNIFDLDLLFGVEENHEEKGKADFLEIMKNLFIFPMIFLHELTHFIVALLLFIKPTKLFVSSPFKKDIFGVVLFGTLKKYTNRMIVVSMAPLLIFLSAIILPIINPCFFIFSIYVLLTIKHSIPSISDMKFILSQLLLRKKYKNDELDYIMNIINKKSTLKDLIFEIKKE